MKWVSALIISGCVAAFGFCTARKYQTRLEIGENFLLFLHFARTELVYCGQPVVQMIRRFQTLHEKRALPFLEQIEEPVGESVDAAMKGMMSLNQRQKQLITEFFYAFGTADESASVQLIDHYAALFSAVHQSQLQQCAQTMKVIKSICVAGALAVFIILI